MPPIRTDKLNEIVRRTNESNSARLRALIEQRRRDLSLDRYPLMYQPYQPSVPDTPTPLRYEPQPHYGLYEYPASTGMAESYPITAPGLVAAPAVTRPEKVVEDLFSEEATARRALKQRYAESNFDNKAKSHAGAIGAWQIMPITYKDYLGRGRGKAGDLNDPEYNRKVRDWVMGIIPRDLQDLYSENDAPRVKLAKIYGAYNWGAGNMRKYLRKQREAGVDISNDTSWVEGLNPETKRYIKYLALDEDIPDSTYTNRAFEEAAVKRGYMAEGGKMFKTGGPAYPYGSLRSLANGIANTYLVDYINRGNVFGYPRGIKSWLKNYAMSPYNKIGRDLAKSSENDIARRALLSKYLGVTEGLDFDPSEYVEESPYKPSISTDEGKIYYRLKARGRDDRRAMFDAVAGMYKTGKGVDEDGRRYLSLYDIWDLAPFSGKARNELPGNPVELYDRIYEDEDPFTYYRYFPEDNPQNDKSNSDIPNDVLVDIRNFWSSATNQNASGGSIHIKPSHRGRLTELKARTGKTEAELYNDGNPAHKRMVVFARNARKWHGDGGLLDKLGSVYGNDRARMLDVIRKVKQNRFDGGGEKGDSTIVEELKPAVVTAYKEEPLYLDEPYVDPKDFFTRWYPNRRAQMADNMANYRSWVTGWPFGQRRRAEKNVDTYIDSMLRNNDNVKQYILKGPHIWGSYENYDFPNALNDPEARKILSEHVTAKYNLLGKEIPKEGFDDWDLRMEMYGANGFSYDNDKYHVFYAKPNPSMGTQFHELSHTLRSVPGELPKYDTSFGYNPITYQIDKIQEDLIKRPGFFAPINATNDYSRLVTPYGLEMKKKEPDDYRYYMTEEEVKARLNAVRANQGINPRRTITEDDLKEIKKRASDSDHEFLDFYTDEALLRFFNDVATTNNETLLENYAEKGGCINRKK